MLKYGLKKVSLTIHYDRLLCLSFFRRRLFILISQLSQTWLNCCLKVVLKLLNHFYRSIRPLKQVEQVEKVLPQTRIHFLEQVKLVLPQSRIRSLEQVELELLQS